VVETASPTAAVPEQVPKLELDSNFATAIPPQRYIGHIDILVRLKQVQHLLLHLKSEPIHSDSISCSSQTDTMPDENVSAPPLPVAAPKSKPVSEALLNEKVCTHARAGRETF
jgi:hypothetical protein